MTIQSYIVFVVIIAVFVFFGAEIVGNLGIAVAWFGIFGACCLEWWRNGKRRRQ